MIKQEIKMITINELMVEVQKIKDTEIEGVKPKTKEWLEKKDKCLVEILKQINNTKLKS